jgi:hypothetical protein
MTPKATATPESSRAVRAGRRQARTTYAATGSSSTPANHAVQASRISSAGSSRTAAASTDGPAASVTLTTRGSACLTDQSASSVGPGRSSVASSQVSCHASTRPA